jgi:maltooligosyltrehalose trehalohydrolase
LGRAIDFRRPEVRRFYTKNALYWLQEFQFDGLRFDAVHTITHPDWLDETAAEIRATLPSECYVHFVPENDDNVASHMRDGYFSAQWNDDAHHVLHVLLTGETGSYYVDYAESPAVKLARSLLEGFIFQGDPSINRGGAPRGTPSGDLPPQCFVLFLQNHDQVGNRAFGERLTELVEPHALEAAIALQILAPHIPLLFIGEEYASKNPFLFFSETNVQLASSIREGRKREIQARGGGAAGSQSHRKFRAIDAATRPAAWKAPLPLLPVVACASARTHLAAYPRRTFVERTCNRGQGCHRALEPWQWLNPDHCDKSG